MKFINALFVGVGILVTVWACFTLGFPEPETSTWIAFLTWASFCAAGLTQSIACGAVEAHMEPISQHPAVLFTAKTST